MSIKHIVYRVIGIISLWLAYSIGYRSGYQKLLKTIFEVSKASDDGSITFIDRAKNSKKSTETL